MPVSINTVSDLEPFIYNSVPQPEGAEGSSSNRLNEQQLQDYLSRLLTALQETIESLIPTGVTQDFSTEEQVTPRTWVDGRPVYQKTVEFGQLPNNTSKTVDHGIPDLDEVIEDRGFAHDPDTTESIPIPFPSNTPADTVTLSIDSTGITITTNQDRTAFDDCFFTLIYTKTSDR